jgi:tetratricopeptide (TPR) repeat protein
MQSTALSRKDKRAWIAKVAKVYGIKGEESADIHRAYQALREEDVMTAVQLAHPISQSHPSNIHPWLILGGAALAQREGTTAVAFFKAALKIGPRNADALMGLAKAYVLGTEPEQAVSTAEKAFEVGAQDDGLLNIYFELMTMMGRRGRIIETLTPILKKSTNAAHLLRMGELLTELEEPVKAAFWLDRAWQNNPEPEQYRHARLASLVYSRKFDQAEEVGNQMLADPEITNKDAVIVLMVLVLRIRDRHQEALDLAEGHEFSNPESYAAMRGISANIMQDLGREEDAAEAYLEGMHVTGAKNQVAKAYGVFKMRGGEFAEGAKHYAERFEEGMRQQVPYSSSSPENMSELKQMFLVGEQGVGDQLALLNLLRLAPIDLDKVDVSYIGDKRFVRALADNDYGVTFIERDAFLAEGREMNLREMVYVGDLARYIDVNDRAAHQGAWFRPDPARTAHLRDKYLRQAKGQPVHGVAWTSGAMLGHLRSVPLIELLKPVPQGALVVNLQYGDHARDIAEAKKARPDLTFLTDGEVDQMKDLAGFFAQIMAIDRIITIDNTTAHACGALGHKDTHVMIPAGSECMWYWGLKGSPDPWYGNLNLYRQEKLRQWEQPLSKLIQALSS